MTKAAEAGVTLDQAQGDEYDGLELEVKSVDAHLARLRELEKSNLAAATKITPVPDTKAASELRGGGLPVIQVKSPLPKGTAFVRMCIALARGKGDSYQTLQYAKQWQDSTPEVEPMIQHMWHSKAAVAARHDHRRHLAGPLVVTQPLNEFLELLRPRTLLGQIPGLRQVPFNISVPSQTAGGTYGWVGQGLAKPVTKAAYATVTLPFAKAAGIIVLTQELVQLSTPVGRRVGPGRNDRRHGAVSRHTVRRSGRGGGGERLAGLNHQWRLDGRGEWGHERRGAPRLGDLGGGLHRGQYSLGRLRVVDVRLQRLWPRLVGQCAGTAALPRDEHHRGSIFGIPVIVSNNVGNRIILLHAPSVLYADEGGVQIDVSREASVQMDSAPDSPATATTVLVSLWQNNLVGLRAERMITWKLGARGGRPLHHGGGVRRDLNAARNWGADAGHRAGRLRSRPR